MLCTLNIQLSTLNINLSTFNINLQQLYTNTYPMLSLLCCIRHRAERPESVIEIACPSWMDLNWGLRNLYISLENVLKEPLVPAG